ncbi:imelysin family protein [Bdellovibrio sp. HCB337]|uniref:imelysin family protein n=1 Tax=Bdellovibrio sp. HCB337 TaxID=3394358 RepID=UPI0039A758FE
MKTWIVSLVLSVGMMAQAATHKEIIENVAVNVITQTYKDLAARAADLKNKVDVFAQAPTEANLATAQQAWRDARIPWEASEAFLFGPVDALGLDPMMDTWPLNVLDLDAVLASNRALTPDFVRGLGTNVQGFHTIEYLLFGNGVNGPHKPLAAFNAKQLQYLQATSTLLAEYTGRLAYAWTNNYDPEIPSAPGYMEIVRNPNMRNPIYTSERAVLEELIRGMMGIADEVGTGKMSDPLGGDISSANAALVESPFAWNSLPDFAYNIRSIKSVYTGAYGTTQGPGIRDFVVEHDPALAAKVDAKIDACIAQIQAIAGPENLDFRQAIFDPAGRARTQAAIAGLGELFVMLENEVLPLLDQ